jgi:uncharacterized membrane protein/YHS domain-containing protein
MQNSVSLCVTALLMFCCGVLQAVESAAPVLPNPYCPVLTDEKSDPDTMIEYQGKKIYFCCGKCVRKFKAEPEKYLANLPQFQDKFSSPVAQQVDKASEKAAAAKTGEAGGEKEHTDEEDGAPKTMLEFVGHLHLVAVHFPIALVLVAALFELLGLFAFRESMAGATRAILWVGSFCAVGTALTGWILASFQSYNAELGKILTLHRWGGTSLALLLLVTLAFREKAERGGGTRWKWAYRLGLLAAAVLTMLVGHWGGQLVNGPEFLALPS